MVRITPLLGITTDARVFAICETLHTKPVFILLASILATTLLNSISVRMYIPYRDALSNGDRKLYTIGFAI